MRQLTGILLDALYETLDRKSLFVLLGLSAIFWLLAFCITFRQTPFEDALRKGFAMDHDLEIASIEDQGAGRHRVVIGVADGDAARGMLAEMKRVEQLLAGERVTHHWGEVEREGGEPLSLHEARDLFGRIAASRLYGLVSVEEAGPPEGASAGSGSGSAPGARWFALTLQPPHPMEIASGGEIDMFFGLWVFDIPNFGGGGASFASILMMVQSFLAGVCGGFAGMFIAVIATGNFFPSMLREGSIDLLLARPVHRVLIFFGRYLGGLIYVAIAAGGLIGGTWLAFSARNGFWNVGYLGTIASLIMMFALLYAISVFWAVITRSMITAVLMTMLAWFCFSMVGVAKGTIDMLDKSGEVDVPAPVIAVSHGLYWIFPVTGDFDTVNTWCIAQAPISEAMRERFLKRSGYVAATKDAPLHWSLMRTGAFTILVLAAGCIIFVRKEY